MFLHKSFFVFFGASPKTAVSFVLNHMAAGNCKDICSQARLFFFRRKGIMVLNHLNERTAKEKSETESALCSKVSEYLE